MLDFSNFVQKDSTVTPKDDYHHVNRGGDNCDWDSGNKVDYQGREKDRVAPTRVIVGIGPKSKSYSCKEHWKKGYPKHQSSPYRMGLRDHSLFSNTFRGGVMIRPLEKLDAIIDIGDHVSGK